ncbi:MAG TPA: RNA polymerase sigma factor [Acidimicrobiales bacterium]|nr:RNA polymerase sigma factor [Acidimicrobiales bacterium]
MKMPFERVVADHSVTVLRVCRAVVGPHDADDAWSETFLSAMRTYPDLPDDANIEAWLVTIAHRKAIDIVRKQKRIDNSRTVELEERASITSSDPTSRDLWDSIRSLPDKQRHAVVYHYLGGLRYVEVSQIIGGTTDAARRAAADGIRNLRRTIIDVESKGA